MGAEFVSKSDTNIESKFRPNTAPSRGGSTNPNLNSLNLTSKFAGKSDAKSVNDSAASPVTTPLLSTSVLTPTTSLLTALLTGPLTSPAKSSSTSLTIPPTASPTTLETVIAPAADLGDLSSNPQSFAQQRTANPALVTASPSPSSPTAPSPLPIPQPVVIAAQIVTTGTSFFASTPEAPSFRDRTGPSATPTVTSTSAATSAGSAAVAAGPTSDFNKSLDVLLDRSGAVDTTANLSVPRDASSQAPDLPSAVGQAASDLAYSFLNVPAQPYATPGQFSIPPVPVSPMTAPAGFPPLAVATPTQSDAPVPSVSAAPTSAGSAAPSAADSRFQAAMPASATIVGLEHDQAATVQSPPAVSFAAAAPTPATPVTRTAPSSLPDHSSNQSAPLPADSQFRAVMPASATIVGLAHDQAATVQSAPAAVFTTASATPATSGTGTEPSSLPDNSSDQPARSPTDSQVHMATPASTTVVGLTLDQAATVQSAPVASSAAATTAMPVAGTAPSSLRDDSSEQAAPLPADSQFQASMLASTTIVGLTLDQAKTVQSPLAASFTPAVATPAMPVTKTVALWFPDNFSSQAAPLPADSQAHTATPASPTIDGLAHDQAATLQSPPAALFTAAAPTPAMPVAGTAPSSLPDHSFDKPALSSVNDSIQVPAANPAFNFAPLTFSAPTPAPTVIPTPQSRVMDDSFAPLPEPSTAKQAAAFQSSDLRGTNSTPGSLTAAELAPSAGSAALVAAPAPAVPSDASATAAAQTGGPPETGFAIANDVTNDLDSNNVSPVTSNSPKPNPNSATPAATAAPNATPIAAANRDAASNAKPGVSAQPATAAAFQTTAADKKSSAAGPPNAVSSSATPSSATPPFTGPSSTTPPSTAPSHDVPAALAAGRDPSATLTAAAPPAAAPPTQAASAAAPELPQTHQMLDSAPPAPAPPAPAPIATDPAAPAQMHVGIHTDAFGAVEIHTVVQQSQVGITVHSDRDIGRWFSSEVPGLTSGLNNSHLNLTGVNFDSGRSGVQTATSFQQGQPRQHSSETPGSQSAVLTDASPEKDAASESAPIDILPSDLSLGPAQTHVSIHV